MKSLSRRCLFAVVVVLSTALFSLATAEGDDDYTYIPREEGAEDQEQGEHTMNDADHSRSDAASHHQSGGGGGSVDPSQELASLSKDDQLMVLEDAIDEIRKNEVQPALARVGRLTDMHSQAKANSGWIKSAAEKQRIYSLETELGQATSALVKAQSKEVALHDQMKPLYGIISYQFMQEQQATIQGSLKKMNKMAYDNAWWSSVFNSGRAESISDLIVQFFLNWLMTYVMMYPFAVAYYALWSAPWSIYAYSSGSSDVVPGVMAWATGTAIMVLPLVVLGVGIFLVVKKYGPELARKAREAQEQKRQQEQRHYERVTGQRRQFDEGQRQRQQQQWQRTGVGATD